MAYHGIISRRRNSGDDVLTKAYPLDVEWFRRAYLDELMPTPLMAKQIGCCNETVNAIAKRLGIPIRPRQPKSVRTIYVHLDMAEVRRLYVEEVMPGWKIGEIMGCTASHILRSLKADGVPRRHHNDTKRGRPALNKISLPLAEISEIYATDGKSAQTAADKFGVSRQVIDRIMRENGIAKKPLGKSRNWVGENHPMWRHDLTDKERASRRDMFKAKPWREAVFARDHYACRCCLDNSGGNLNAHHIIPHHRDKSMAWIVNNGITFCKPCHQAFHRKYKYRNCCTADVVAFITDFAMVSA